jgi:hypothetical protein
MLFPNAEAIVNDRAGEMGASATRQPWPERSVGAAVHDRSYLAPGFVLGEVEAIGDEFRWGAF